MKTKVLKFITAIKMIHFGGFDVMLVELWIMIGHIRTKQCALNLFNRINQIAFNGVKLPLEYRNNFADLKEAARQKYFELC